jgi:hypothetical protein
MTLTLSPAQVALLMAALLLALAVAVTPWAMVAVPLWVRAAAGQPVLLRGRTPRMARRAHLAVA